VADPRDGSSGNQALPALLAATAAIILAAQRFSDIPSVKQAAKEVEGAPKSKAELEQVFRRAQATAKPKAQAKVLRKQRPVLGGRSPRVRTKLPAVRPVAPSQVRTPPHRMGEVIAVRRTRSSRQTVVSFLRAAGLIKELEHLVAVEERLSAGSTPAQSHAALSTRLLLAGVADRCFTPRDEPFEDRFGAKHDVKKENVGNRIAAFVDVRLRKGVSDEEHRLFIATLDTVNRWSGRGPHRIYDPLEGQIFFLRLLEVLARVSRAYYFPDS